MAHFRALLEGLGYTDVRTLLNSGNAVFTAAPLTVEKHAKRIRDAITESLGVDVPVVVLRRETLDRIVADNPLPPGFDPSRMLVAFPLTQASLRPMESLRTRVAAGESLHIGPDAAYLHCPNGILDSAIATAMLGKAGSGVTTRNWATTLKLHAVAGS